MLLQHSRRESTVAADTVEVDDAAASDYHGLDGAGFNPAAHYVSVIWSRPIISAKTCCEQNGASRDRKRSSEFTSQM